jgi:acetyl esterase/lipase
VIGTGCGVAALEPPAEAKSKASPSTCVQGVIDWYGLVDLESHAADLGKDRKPVSNDYLETYLGCELARCAAGRMRSASPLAYIDAKDPPFLIQHGLADTTVSSKQSQRLHDALRAAGVPSEIVMYPGVSHGFSKVPGGGPDDAVNQQALDKVFEFLARRFPTVK